MLQPTEAEKIRLQDAVSRSRLRTVFLWGLNTSASEILRQCHRRPCRSDIYSRSYSMRSSSLPRTFASCFAAQCKSEEVPGICMYVGVLAGQALSHRKITGEHPHAERLRAGIAGFPAATYKHQDFSCSMACYTAASNDTGLPMRQGEPKLPLSSHNAGSF